MHHRAYSKYSAVGKVTQKRRLRGSTLKQGAETATFYGNQLPQRISSLRANYMKDMHTMLEHFARIGRELKSYPVQHRNYHLRSAVTTLNEMLFNRMLSRGTSLTGHGINLRDLEDGEEFGMGIEMGVGPASEEVVVERACEGSGGDPPPPPPRRCRRRRRRRRLPLLVAVARHLCPARKPTILQHYQQQQQQVAAMTASDRAFQPGVTTAYTWPRCVRRWRGTPARAPAALS